MVDFMKISNMALPAFLGKSLTTQSQIDMYMKNKEITDFLSIEPILERLDLSQAIVTTRTVIIGAETGIRKGKVVPEKEWIDDIVKEADNYNIYVFMKESLRSIMGDDFRQDALPWDWRKDK
jgi:protein gp37